MPPVAPERNNLSRRRGHNAGCARARSGNCHDPTLGSHFKQSCCPSECRGALGKHLMKRILGRYSFSVFEFGGDLPVSHNRWRSRESSPCSGRLCSDMRRVPWLTAWQAGTQGLWGAMSVALQVRLWCAWPSSGCWPSAPHLRNSRSGAGGLLGAGHQGLL